MDFRLKILGGAKSGQEIPVRPGKFFIGRAEDCHLRPHSDLISRHHCVFTHADEYTSIRDFGSKNGTYVNGERLVGERELRAGDTLKVGPLEFEVVLEAKVGGAKQPAVVDVREAVSRFAGRKDDSADEVGDWLSGDDPEDAAPDNPSASETMAISHSETVIGGDELRSLMDAASQIHEEPTVEIEPTSEDGDVEADAPVASAETPAAASPEPAGPPPQAAPSPESISPESSPASSPAPSTGQTPAYPIPGILAGGQEQTPANGPPQGFPPGVAPNAPAAAEGQSPPASGPYGPYPGYPYAPQGMPYGYWPQGGPPQGAPQGGAPQGYGYPPQFYGGFTPPYGYPPQPGQGDQSAAWPGPGFAAPGYPAQGPMGPNNPMVQGGQGVPGMPAWPGMAWPGQAPPGAGSPAMGAPALGQDGPQNGPPAPHFPQAAPTAEAASPPTAPAAPKPAEAAAPPPAAPPRPAEAPAPPPSPAAATRKPNYFVPDAKVENKDEANAEEAAKSAGDKDKGDSRTAAADTLRKFFSRR